MGDKEELWSRAHKVGLVTGEVGGSQYLRTSTKALNEMLSEWETEKLKPVTTSTDMTEFIPASIDEQQQRELSKALAEIERQKRMRGALEAENRMLVAKLNDIQVRMSKYDKVVEKEVIEDILKPAPQGNNGEPTILCEVMITSYSVGGKVYTQGQTLQVPQSKTYTNSLKILEPRQKLRKQ